LPTVEARGLTAGYLGEPPVLRDITLELGEGELLLLLGPTGSGKSTLLLSLAGAVPRLIPGYVEGFLRVAGSDPRVEGLARMARRLGLLLQDPEAQTVMFKVYEEVYFPLENLKYPPGEIPLRARAALRLVGLEDAWQREVDSLSTGQKQRLALASTLAPGPGLLLLDEPTAHIDPASSEEVYRVVGSLKKSGVSAIVVEHRVEYVEEWADRVAFLADGRLEAAGSIDELAGRLGVGRLASAGVWVPPRLLKPASVERPRLRPRDPLVVAEGVSLEIEGRRILRGVDITARRGEVVAVIGPNGAGKTTLLRILAGVLGGWEGRVEVSGAPPEPGRAVYVTQVPDHQFVSRTVLGEVAASYIVQGYTRRRAEEEAMRVLEERGLAGLARRSLYRLSQGQKRLVSLIAMEPLDRPVYLLDEPTFGLDMRYSLLVAREVEGLAARGKAVILVTHDSWLPALLDCRVYGISEGRVVFEGGYRELLEDKDSWKRIGFKPPRMLEEDPGMLEEYRARLWGAAR